MKYSEITKPALKSFCEDLNIYLTNKKHIILYELKELISCFSLSHTIAIKGALEFKIHSRTRAENGTVTTLSETIIFSSKGYTIKSFSQEGHFGEYYTNNDFRINEEEAEEHISLFKRRFKFNIRNLKRQ